MAVSRNSKTGRFEKSDNRIDVSKIDKNKIENMFDSCENFDEAIKYIADLLTSHKKSDEKKKEEKNPYERKGLNTVFICTNLNTDGEVAVSYDDGSMSIFDKYGNELTHFDYSESLNKKVEEETEKIKKKIVKEVNDKNDIEEAEAESIGSEENDMFKVFWFEDGHYRLFFKYTDDDGDTVYMPMRTMTPLQFIDAYKQMYNNPSVGFNFTNPKMNGNPESDDRFDKNLKFIKCDHSIDGNPGHDSCYVDSNENDEEDDSCEDADECPCVGFGNRNAYCSNKDCTGKCPCEDDDEDDEEDHNDHPYSDYVNVLRECEGCDEAYNEGYIDAYKELSEKVINQLIAALSSM